MKSTIDIVAASGLALGAVFGMAGMLHILGRFPGALSLRKMRPTV